MTNNALDINDENERKKTTEGSPRRKGIARSRDVSAAHAPGTDYNLIFARACTAAPDWLPTIPLFTRYLEDRYNPYMDAYRKPDQKRRRARASSKLVLMLAIIPVLSPLQALHSRETSTSTQLLQSYFDTAGVCTTSTVDSITETQELLTVNITIEKATAKALLGSTSKLKDDWFSLHCPPEIHGIWRQPEPPDDVLISGALDTAERHNLSCRTYREKEYARILTFRERIRVALERLVTP